MSGSEIITSEHAAPAVIRINGKQYGCSEDEAQTASDDSVELQIDSDSLKASLGDAGAPLKVARIHDGDKYISVFAEPDGSLRADKNDLVAAIAHGPYEASDEDAGSEE